MFEIRIELAHVPILLSRGNVGDDGRELRTRERAHVAVKVVVKDDRARAALVGRKQAGAHVLVELSAALTGVANRPRDIGGKRVSQGCRAGRESGWVVGQRGHVVSP